MRGGILLRVHTPTYAPFWASLAKISYTNGYTVDTDSPGVEVVYYSVPAREPGQHINPENIGSYMLSGMLGGVTLTAEEAHTLVNAAPEVVQERASLPTTGMYFGKWKRRCMGIESFRMKIAGLVTEIHPLYETTKVYCSKYLTDLPAAFTVTVSEEDLAFEQRMLDAEAREEGMKLRKFTPPFLERAAIQRKIAEELLNYDTFLLHGSTVAVDGKAYLFTAACGTGKSTHTRLWREAFAGRAVMVNDDKPFLQQTEEGVIAYGSPWSGKHGLDTNVAFPLNGICILHRGKESVIRKIRPEEALPMLHHQSYGFTDTASQEKIFALVETLARSVPLWEMDCTKSVDAALLSHGAMSAEKNTGL